MASNPKVAAAAVVPFSPRVAQRVRKLRRPRAMIVNQPQPLQSPPPANQIVQVMLVADGYLAPKPTDPQFDFAIRLATIGPGAGGSPNVVIQNVFTVEDRIKGGWISHLGYEYNNPHGFFQVQTTILVNSGTPATYHFRNIDSATGAVDGTFPVAQIGTIAEPTAVKIGLPSNGLVQIRASNFSQDETFSLVVRLKGWTFGQ